LDQKLLGSFFGCLRRDLIEGSDLSGVIPPSKSLVLWKLLHCRLPTNDAVQRRGSLVVPYAGRKRSLFSTPILLCYGHEVLVVGET